MPLYYSLASLALLFASSLALRQLPPSQQETVLDREAGAAQPQKRSLLGKRFPDVVIAGAAKCGTRALLEIIGAHPDVAWAPNEMKFYSSLNFLKGREWYLQNMPVAREDQLVMEKTPEYFTFPRAPVEILRTNNRTKIILVFRDPVKRAASKIAQLMAKGHLKPVEEQLLDKLGELRVKEEVIGAGRYSEHLRRWFRLFPPEQLLVLDGGTLVERPWEELEKAQRFLGLRQLITESSFVRDARKPGFYCWRLQENEEPKCLGATKGRPSVEIPKALQQRLRKYYLPYDRKLVKMLGREMSWTKAEVNATSAE